jgi:hypothetical protein
MKGRLLFVLLFSAGLAQAADQPYINQLERLFTTPMERAQLDAKRRRKDPGNEQQTEAHPGVVVPPAQVELKGIMIRDGAPNVAWVNDGNTLKSRRIDERIRVNPESISKNEQVPVFVNGQKVRLKPGQVWNEFDQDIQDKYEIKESSLMQEISDKFSPDQISPKGIQPEGTQDR